MTNATDPEATMIEALCRFIETAERPPTLDELARHAHVSPSHLHRTFRRITGVTPHQYAARVRTERLHAGLASGAAVAEAAYLAGYGSSGRLYENADAALGMSPGQYRAGGDATTISFAVGECSLGSLLVAATTRGICAILLGDDPEQLVHDLERRFPRAELVGDDPGFDATVARVVGFVEHPEVGLDLPLDIRGTAFQQRVWEALRAIPPGSTASYAQIAERIGMPRATRAVAQACGANALAVAIPCHRVVRTDGSLSGYRWGVDRKRALLEREHDDSQA